MAKQDKELNMLTQAAQEFAKKELAPKRAVPTAWFDPFPPGPISKSEPISVSPKIGIRLVRSVMPTAKLPTTVITGFVINYLQSNDLRLTLP